MKFSIGRRIAITAFSLALIGIVAPVSVNADSTAVTTTTTQTTSQTCLPSVTRETTVTTPGYVVIEKPVVLHDTEKIKEKQVVYIERYHRSKRIAARKTAVVRPKMVKRIAARPVLKQNKSLISERVIDRTIEKPIVVERPVVIDRTIDRVIDNPVVLEKKVTVEQAPMIEKQVQIEQPVLIPAPAVVQTEVLQKPAHHLLDFKLF
jgi:UDP-3-O-[3-hydroxymyristoyl] glucosamine N-acyltransferase